ncbi:MAG: adenylate/guanylate cyclase domain-containing protein [Bacteroidales bacterium]|nr:adenylate/guanylate cyclase domain-containing protein [Bacteroidales bacterium]
MKNRFKITKKKSCSILCKIAVFWGLFLILIIQDGFSQINRNGIPLITNYSQDIYNSFPQNWQAVQDSRGVMYFANQTGIIIYDGSKWRQIKVGDNVFIRSLAVDDEGIVYFGTSNSFGYLFPDDNGNLTPVLLSDSFSQNDNLKYDFWKIVPVENYIFFFNECVLFRYNKNTEIVNTWELEFDIFQVFSYRNELYLSSYEKGLEKLIGDSITILNNGNFFSDKAIVSMLPFSNQSFLVVTYENGLYEVEFKDSLTLDIPRKIDINIESQHYYYYSAISLNDNRIALATIGGGLIIINKDGFIVNKIDEQDGLISNNIASLYLSKAGGQNSVLWVITDKGISKLDFFSPVSLFDGHHGIKGLISDVVRFNDILYVATPDGLFYQTTNESNGLTIFKRIEEIDSEVRKFVVIRKGGKEKLIACTAFNLYEVNGLNLVQITQRANSISLYQLKNDSSLAYISLDKGLAKLRIHNDSYEYLGPLSSSGVTDMAKIISEDAEGNLWLLSIQKGVIHFNTQLDTIIKIYNKETDTTLSNINCFFEWDNILFIGTKKGIYQFDKDADRFIPAKIFGDNSEIQSLELLRVYIENDILWAVIKENDRNSIGKIDLRNNTYEKIPYRRILEQNLWGFYNDSDNQLLVFSTDKLYLFDKNYEKQYDLSFNALIRKVTLNTDSVIFYGNYYDYTNNNKSRVLAANQHSETIRNIKFKYNNVSFEFAAPFFESEESILYSYFLEGNDNTWSDWSSRSDKEYTNLFEGKYTFHVKAKNVYGTESIIAAYSFIILPPWYRTIWAYIIYIIFLGLFILGIVKLSIYRLQKINEAYGKYLPGSFLKMLDKRRVIDFKLGDMVEKEMSVMFSDIRSYTKLSESMTPQDNFKFLVRYLKYIGEMLNKNKGFPVQYYGDGIMAMFYGKTDNPVQAAIDMHKKVAEYSAERIKKGRREIKIGIGLHTGKVIMGIRGDQWRWEGGIVGDAVNIAARIEGLTKLFGAATVISEDVYSRLENPENFTFRYLGNVQVKGKDKTIKVYELIDGNPPEVYKAKMEILDDFNKGIIFFNSRDFDAALSVFKSITEHHNDLASAYYIDVINKIKSQSLTDFDGTLIMDIK